MEKEHQGRWQMSVLLNRDRFRVAVLASLLLHATVALLLPATVLVAGSGPAIETLTFVRALPMRIETPHPMASPPPVLAPIRARVVRVAPEAAAPVGHRPAMHHTLAHRFASVARAPHVGMQIAEGATNTPRPLATAAPSAAPSVALASVETRRETGGYMPLGADIPVPILDPNVESALKALGLHVTLLVLVDANGHTKKVTFRPALDPASQQRVRRMLAEASWDPAICGGGVGCEATATIRL